MMHDTCTKITSMHLGKRPVGTEYFDDEEILYSLCKNFVTKMFQSQEILCYKVEE
jgi:hypothetical protein